MSERDALLSSMAAAWGITWFDYQLEMLDGERGTDAAELRACAYYATGKGKTYTSLAVMKQAGVDDILVVAPPATHSQWQQHAAKVGLTVLCMSHAKYRQKGLKFSRLRPVIIDEFHLLGGQDKLGFTRFRTHAKSLQAPVVILSATPNYNDVERVYCIEQILDPMSSRGGYIEWLYKRCDTEHNPFGKLPKVSGFSDGRDARETLASMPHVYYVEDEHADFHIADIVLPTDIPEELELYGINRRTGRICASRMEQISSSRKWQLIDDAGLLRAEVYIVLTELVGMSPKPVLVYAHRAEVAIAAFKMALAHGARAGLVHGQATPKAKAAVVQSFKDGELDVLFCTATIGTGVDGLDKVCDMLILLDDTDDDSLRRQIIGRILPRGADSDASNKVVTRLLLGA